MDIVVSFNLREYRRGGAAAACRAAGAGCLPALARLASYAEFFVPVAYPL